MKTLLFLLLPFLFLSGCAHIISEKSRLQADRSITFAGLRENPDAYKGKFVILGGLITGVKQVPEGFQLEVIEYGSTARRCRLPQPVPAAAFW